MEIKIRDHNYEVVKNEKDAIDIDLLQEKVTEYYDDFDYIFGDWAYSKLRLKGFNDKGNKNFKPLNDYRNIDKYIKECCAYGCRHFILKKKN